MATVHISEAEAASDFAGLIARVRVGEEFVIESDLGAVAIVRPAEAEFRPRLLSDCIAEERLLEAEGGEPPVFDSDFADDLAEIIRNRKPWNPPVWE
jgi:antitoxin (DNA-binding transcriptional repressor) of toxin-antitoxin stability system